MRRLRVIRAAVAVVVFVPAALMFLDAGRLLPARMVLVPTDTEGQRTEMRYLDVSFDVKVPDDTFSLSRLERGL